MLQELRPYFWSVYKPWATHQVMFLFFLATACCPSLCSAIYVFLSVWVDSNFRPQSKCGKADFRTWFLHTSSSDTHSTNRVYVGLLSTWLVLNQGKGRSSTNHFMKCANVHAACLLRLKLDFGGFEGTLCYKTTYPATLNITNTNMDKQVPSI